MFTGCVTFCASYIAASAWRTSCSGSARGPCVTTMPAPPVTERSRPVPGQGAPIDRTIRSPMRQTGVVVPGTYPRERMLSTVKVQPHEVLTPKL